MTKTVEALRIPRGDLVRSRVVVDLQATLDAALARSLTGYVVVEPGGSLLLDGEIRGVLTFEDGVPVLAYSPETDRSGVDALADLAGPGPWAVDCYEVPETALREAHDTPSFQVPPGAPAEELAGEPGLADRTRERAPEERLGDDHDSAVEAFLADDERIAAIQEEARAEAERRAAEWGLDDHLVE
jgi:hypothetical protein